MLCKAALSVISLSLNTALTHVYFARHLQQTETGDTAQLDAGTILMNCFTQSAGDVSPASAPLPHSRNRESQFFSVYVQHDAN